jgi:hypothetical protein
MGQYNRAIITTAGENLIARAIVGEMQLNITKAKTSDHKYPEGTYFKDLTDMQGVKQVMTSPETKVVSGDMIQTRSLFSNEEVQSTYYIQNIGLYAMDGIQDVLFCIVTATTPDEMPQYNGVAATSYIYNIQNVVQGAEEIHITVNPSGTATIQDVMERVDATGGDISETVIETLEPIDTKYPVPSAGESTKVFMGKVKRYIEDTKPLDADMTVYVATTGSDSTGNGTESNPFKTVQYAINTLPKDLNNYKATVNIADGTYGERVTVTSFHSGILLIQSKDHPTELNNLCTLEYLQVRNTTGEVTISGLTLTSTVSAGVDIFYSNVVNLQYTTCTTPISNRTGIYINNSRVNVAACNVSNRSTGIVADNNSIVWASANIGSGNTKGIRSAYGATIHLTDNHLLPSNQEFGGQFINENGTQISNLITSGISCTWGNVLGGYVRHGNSNGIAMVTLQFGLITTANISADTSYLITGLPTPATGNVVINFGPQYVVSNCYLNGTTITFVPRVNVPTGAGFLFNATYLVNA